MLSHVIRAQSYDESGRLATIGEYTIVRRKKVGSGEIFIGRSMTEGIPYLVAQIDYHRAPEVVYICCLWTSRIYIRTFIFIQKCGMWAASRRQKRRNPAICL